MDLKVEKRHPGEALEFNYFLAYRGGRKSGTVPDGTNVSFQESEAEGGLVSIADNTFIKLAPGYIYKLTGYAGVKVDPPSGYIKRGFRFFQKVGTTYSELKGSLGISYVGTRTEKLDNDTPAICYIKVQHKPMEIVLKVLAGAGDGSSDAILAGTYVNIEAIRIINI